MISTIQKYFISFFRWISINFGMLCGVFGLLLIAAALILAVAQETKENNERYRTRQQCEEKCSPFVSKMIDETCHCKDKDGWIASNGR